MPEEKIEKRVGLKVVRLDCPRCGKGSGADQLERTQAIFNHNDRGVLVTLACPLCSTLVQVYASGECYP
jgi:endogenous inhibitor of DNA gyrase (YacG/DUF329 family)